MCVPSCYFGAQDSSTGGAPYVPAKSAQGPRGSDHSPHNSQFSTVCLQCLSFPHGTILAALLEVS